jgi:hypothetical protein
MLWEGKELNTGTAIRDALPHISSKEQAESFMAVISALYGQAGKGIVFSIASHIVEFTELKRVLSLLFSHDFTQPFFVVSAPVDAFGNTAWKAVLKVLLLRKMEDQISSLLSR